MLISDEQFSVAREARHSTAFSRRLIAAADGCFVQPISAAASKQASSVLVFPASFEYSICPRFAHAVVG